MSDDNNRRFLIGNLVVEALPRLRRFGYMLTRSKEQSDDVIRTILRRLADDPDVSPDHLSVTVYTFRMFLKELEELNEAPLSSPASGLGHSVDESLAGLCFRQRQVFLLRFIDEFARSLVAKIMNLTENEVLALEQQVMHIVNTRHVLH